MDADLTVVAARAIAEMLVMVAVGIAGVRAGIIGDAETGALTRFMMNITCPAMILASYMQAFEPSKARMLAMAAGMGAVIHIAGILLSHVAIRPSKTPDWQVERMAVVYGNVGFMGIPLMNAMFGSEAVFYLSGMILMFSVFIWSHGLILMTGRTDKKSMLNVLKSPNMICIAAGIAIYLCRIPVPDIVRAPLDSIGSCTTPVAMVVSGSIIARSSFAQALGNRRTYFVCALRLFAVPAAVFAVVRLLGLPHMVALTAFTAAACPVGAMVTMFAVEHGKNSAYASGLFTVSTVVSLLSIPALTALYGVLS